MSGRYDVVATDSQPSGANEQHSVHADRLTVDYTLLDPRRQYDLWLSKNPETSDLFPYVILDGNDGDKLVTHATSVDQAVGWMRKFAAETGARVDETSIEIARGAERSRVELREALALAPAHRISDGKIVA